MSYTKNDWTDILPAAVKAKLDIVENGVKYVNDERDKESAPGRALVEAATVAAQRAALDVDSKAEVTAKANAAKSGAESTAASALAGHVAASDPHTQYALDSALGNAAGKNVGTGSGDVAAGNAPAAAITAHENAYSHANIPSAAGKAVADAAGLFGGTSVQKLASSVKKAQSSLKLIKTTTALRFRAAWDAVYDAVETMALASTYYPNSPVEFAHIKTYLNTVADADIPTATAYALLKDEGDDICPISLGGSAGYTTFIGANHGASFVREITCASAHGKTNVDVGSEWLDGSSVKWYIVKIVSTTKLWLLSANASATDIWSFTTTIGGTTLTHSANATHTENIVFSSSILTQLTPGIRNISRKVYGESLGEITTDGVYSDKFFNVVHTYDILYPPSILAYLIANVGSSAEPDYTNAAVLSFARVRISYKIAPNLSCTVCQSVKFYYETNLNYVGLMQNGPVVIPAGGTLWQYVPGLNPFSASGTTYNLSAMQNITSLAVDLNLITDRMIDANNPPSRYVQFAKTSGGVKNENYGFIMGYAPLYKGLAATRKSNITASGSIAPSKKVYPYLINSGSTNYPTGVVSAGSVVEGVSYRCPINYSLDSDATCIAWYYVGSSIYLMLDYHTNVEKIVSLPVEFSGKAITVIEKSANMTIDNEMVADGGIGIKVTSNYGYAILKLD